MKSLQKDFARTNPKTPTIRSKILRIKRSKHQTIRRHSQTKRKCHRHTKKQYRG